MPRTTPLVPDGYYAWVPRAGQVEDKARFGSSELKAVLKLTGDLYVPDGRGGVRVQRLSREETLAYSAKSNVGTMLAAAIGRLLSDDEAHAEVSDFGLDWQAILDVPMIVRVESHEYHPRENGAEDLSKTFVSTGMKGACVGWPVGVPYPGGMTKIAPLPVHWPRRAPAAEVAPPPATEQAQAAPEAPRAPTQLPTAGPVAALPHTTPPPQAGTTEPAADDPDFPRAREGFVRVVTRALESFGWRSEAEDIPNAAAIGRFWTYFDEVPEVAKLKHVRADKPPTFYNRPPHASASMLNDAMAILAQHAAGVDVREAARGVKR